MVVLPTALNLHCHEIGPLFSGKLVVDVRRSARIYFYIPLYTVVYGSGYNGTDASGDKGPPG
jgi:hypothetical protein